MTCACPDGWPQSQERDFGDHADLLASRNGIPNPRFSVTAHQHPCPLPDAPHTIPEDYAHPQHQWEGR